MKASGTLRLGVIGLGRAAASMLPSLVAHPRIEVVSAAEPREVPRRAFAEQFGRPAHDTAVELCRDPDVDAVYIATPHQYHAEHAILAAENGKHVLVEKPMALTVDECRSMNAAALTHGTVLSVGPTHGYDPPIVALQEHIRTGRYGRVRMISTFNYTNFLYRPRRPEELDTRLGGGIVYNQLPHQIDIVRLLAGADIRSLRASLGTWDPDRATEGSCMAFLDFTNGATATMMYSGYDRFDSDEFVGWVGEGGRKKRPDAHGTAQRALRALAPGTAEAARKADTGFGGTHQKPAGTAPESLPEGGHHPHFGMTIVNCEKADLRIAPDGIVVYDEDGRREVALSLGRTVPDKGRVLDEFYGAVIEGVPAVHDGKWGQATLEACLGILESNRTGQQVFFPLAQEPRLVPEGSVAP